ncbi:MAG: peptidoglycan-binding protein [Ilumatobacteraceae bacterium]
MKMSKRSATPIGTAERAPGSSRRTMRRALVAATVGLAVVAPLAIGSSPTLAEAPTVVVTGLTRGDRGESVRAVQQALVAQGIDVPGGVDGVFGSGTESAVLAFQEREGLRRSGGVDESTAIALGLVSNRFFGLAQGARGETVAELQRKLMAAGLEPAGGADGIFGSGTAAALRSFQESNGFASTGRVDASTAAALMGVTVSASTGGGAAEAPGSSTAVSDLEGLKIGARGAAVVTLQRSIMNAGFTVVGGADGVFGVLTASALTSFQNANGLATSGQVDRATAELLVRIGTGTAPAPHDPTVPASPLLGLRSGALGSDVVALQQVLMNAGHTLRGGADGVFGPATHATLVAFQAANGLPTTGIVDESTAAAIARIGAPATEVAALVGLKAGALGNTVKQLQQALLDAGVRVRGGADGIFGPATAAALSEFQSGQGLPATGVVDEATAAALASPRPIGITQPGPTDGYAQYGERGARVVALQTALLEAGIALRGGVDGVFGGATSAAVMDVQRSHGLPVTGTVDAATAEKMGLAALPAPVVAPPVAVTLSVFPVQGRCGFEDTWGAPRSGGRTHQGVDIIASEGKLLYAVADGTIEKVYSEYPGSLAGNGVRLRQADGTYFFYAHMKSIADGIAVGTEVVAGQVIGYLGNTGNSGTPHLHFEIHPLGGAAINPYPIVKAIDGCSNTEPLPQP